MAAAIVAMLVEPKAYLLSATRGALANPGTVTLPHALLTS